MSVPLGAKGRFRFHPDVIFIGCTIGMLLSCLIAALVGFFLGFRPLIISLALISTSVLIVLFRMLQHLRAKKAAVNVAPKIAEAQSEELIPFYGKAWRRQEYIILSAFLIFVLLLTMKPYSTIGKETEHGVAFTYLIDNDFLQHSAIAAEIAKGVPPQNIYFSGEVFQYHWLSHVFPAFVYLASGRNFATKDILIWVLRCYTILFVCMLFSLVRSFFESRKVQVLVMFLALFAYSYNGVYVALKPFIQSLEIHAAQLPWIGNIANFSNTSNGYFRDFLVEPHTLLALSAALAVMGILHRCSYVPKDKLTSILLGLLLGMTLGVEGFIGMTMLLWFCVTCLYIASKRMGRDKGFVGYGKLTYRRPEFFISISVALAIVSALFILRIFTFKTGVLLFQPYTMIIAFAPIYFLLSYGPSFMLALSGIGLYLRKRVGAVGTGLKPILTPIFLLGLLSVTLIFFVRHFAEPNHVLRKSGKILQISLLILSGVCLDYYFNKITNARAFRLFLSGALVLGLLTLVIDVYSFSNVQDASNTTYVSLNDYKAAKWIRENTPLDAVVQSKPDYISVLNPGNPFFEYSLISMFAERRMAVGDSLHAYIYQIGKKRQAERERDIKEMFTTADIDKGLGIIRRYGIDYIYVGPVEREAYGYGVSKFDVAPDFFKKVYSENGVSIYKLNGESVSVYKPSPCMDSRRLRIH